MKLSEERRYIICILNSNSKNNPDIPLKTTFDQNIKLVTDKGLLFTDIGRWISPFPEFKLL